MNADPLVDRLAAHHTLGSAPREELIWLATHATYRTFRAGEVLSRPEDIVNELYILLAGRVTHVRFIGGGQRRAVEFGTGEVGGLLPFSRMRVSGGLTVAEEATEALELTRNDFPDLITNCPQTTEILVHLMIDRTRLFTSTELRNEKMISLGKLAAGLAHELNNPASAAMSGAKAMAAELKDAREAVHALIRTGLSEPQLSELEKVQELCMTSTQPMSGLAFSDREEEIDAWLRAHGVQNAPAQDLARGCMTAEALDRLAGLLQGKRLEVALRWIAAECAAHSLSSEIERAVARIHSLVASVKGFTHMDRAPDGGPVDIQAGLSDTADLLKGKARNKSLLINLNIASPLPHVQGIGAEINQIWMNLVDNAIDAAPSNGHVEVTATHEGPAVVVRVIDDGPGIPPEIKGSIFDPFFSTKAAGEGTGLGLDIVRRIVAWHNGQVDVQSEPGRTEFIVRLPCLAQETGSLSPIT